MTANVSMYPSKKGKQPSCETSDQQKKIRDFESTKKASLISYTVAGGWTEWMIGKKEEAGRSIHFSSILNSPAFVRKTFPVTAGLTLNASARKAVCTFKRYINTQLATYARSLDIAFKKGSPLLFCSATYLRVSCVFLVVLLYIKVKLLFIDICVAKK